MENDLLCQRGGGLCKNCTMGNQVVRGRELVLQPTPSWRQESWDALLLSHDLGVKSKSVSMTEIGDETSLGDMSDNSEEEEGDESVTQDEL